MFNPSQHTLALDIGGSHVSAAVVDLAAHDLVPGARVRESVDPDASADAILGAWSRAALSALALTNLTEVVSIGIAMPGPFAYEAGVSLLKHKFQALYGTYVVGALRERWADTPLADAPIRMANDAALFALGEWWAGAAQGHDSVIGVTLGTGLGSGFVRHGQLVTSAHDVPPGGEIWNLPYRDGINEDYASGRSITQTYLTATGQALSAAEIAQRATQQDEADREAARAAFQTLGAHLVSILEPLVGEFHPTCIVVGGNIARAWPLFGSQLQGAWSGVACLPTARFDDAALLGAAALSR